MLSIKRFLTHEPIETNTSSSMQQLIINSKFPHRNYIDSPITDPLLFLTPTKPPNYATFSPRTAALYLQDKFPAGSVKGSIFTLIICIVGSGALSVPWAFRVSGLLLGTLLLILASFCSFLSLHFLVYSGLYIKERPSYRNLALKTGGKCLATYTSLNLMCNLIGSTISYLVAVGGILNVVYDSFFPMYGSDKYGQIVFIVAFCIVFPISLMRSMNSLRFGSLIGILCLLFLCLVMGIDYFRLCDDQTVFEGANIHRNTCFWKHNFSLSMSDLFQFSGEGFFASYPIFVFAYTCQPNVLPIYIELQRRSVRRMHKVIRRSIYFAGTLYFLIGMFGYLTFMGGTCGNILQNNFKQHLEVIFAAICISISCMMTLPMLVYALRENLTLFTVNQVQVHWTWHILITGVLVGICAVIATQATHLNVVLGFLGCTTNPSVAYFLPNFFFLKLVPRKKAPVRWWVALISMVLLLALSAVSFAYQILNVVVGSSVATECSAAQEIH